MLVEAGATGGASAVAPASSLMGRSGVPLCLRSWRRLRDRY